MDFLDRAQDLLDKAQERVADATTLAAWKANKAVRLKGVQTQKEQIEEQIGTTTMQLGNRVYRLWKERGQRDDQEMERLCRTLDDLLGRYREVNAELGEINRATYEGMAVGHRSAGPAGTATVLPAGEGGAPRARILAPSPPPASPPPAASPPAAQPPPRARAQPPAAAPDPAPPPARPAPRQAARQRETEPAAEQRPTAKPKPCPSCGATVPAELVYCPQCGYMAR